MEILRKLLARLRRRRAPRLRPGYGFQPTPEVRTHVYQTLTPEEVEEWDKDLAQRRAAEDNDLAVPPDWLTRHNRRTL